VSALFNAGGHHVERNIHQREREDVLELDTVATDYSASKPIRTLVEAKSGGWGYTDLFKVLGWMAYLGFEKGAVIVTTVPKEKDLVAINARLNPHGLRVVCLDGSKNVREQFEAAHLATNVRYRNYSPERKGSWCD
jgi:expansin (peptidoglycan-binding protein)